MHNRCVAEAALSFQVMQMLVLDFVNTMSPLPLQYKAQLDDLRAHAQEDMEVAKRKDGLDWVNVDPAELKPKFA